MEDAALQTPAGEGGEKALDRIGPRAGCGREMEGPPRVPGEPSEYLGKVVAQTRYCRMAGQKSGPRPTRLDLIRNAAL